MTCAIPASVGLAAYSQVDKLGVWFKSVKFGAKTGVPPWRRPRGNSMVSSVNSHTNATRIGWHLWEIDLRFAPGLPEIDLRFAPGWTGVGGEALIHHNVPNSVLSVRLELRLPNHLPHPCRPLHPPGRRTESTPQPYERCTLVVTLGLAGVAGRGTGQPRGCPVPFFAALSMVSDSPGLRVSLLCGTAGHPSLSDEHPHRRVGARWRESRCFSTGPHRRPRHTFLSLPRQSVSLRTQIPFIDAPRSGTKGGASTGSRVGGEEVRGGENDECGQEGEPKPGPPHLVQLRGPCCF